MWFLMSSAQIALKRDNMRLAEAKLLEMARRFGGRHEQQESSSSCQMQVFDTAIPKSAISCLKRNALAQDENELVIHGIQVTNLSSDNEEDGSEKATTRTKKSELPLVLLHGYMNSSAYFYRNLYGLSAYFSTVYSLDMLGWGLSSRPSFSLVDDSVQTTESFFVDSLEAWREQQKIDKMILAGHSMGGYLGVAYCEKYPERVERLVLLSPVGVTEESEDLKMRRKEILRTAKWSTRMSTRLYHYLFDNHTLCEIIRAMPGEMGLRRLNEYVEKRLTSITEPDERETVASYLYLNAVLPGSGEYCVSRILNSHAYAKSPQVHRIPHLQVEHVSFLYGDRDWMDIGGGLDVQKACVEKQRNGEMAPNVTVYKIQNAGHLLMLDNWKEFNSGVLLSCGVAKEVLMATTDSPIPMEQTSRGEAVSSQPLAASEVMAEAPRPEVSAV